MAATPQPETWREHQSAPTLALAHTLVAAAIIAGVVCALYRANTERLREQYVEGHGELEAPAAFSLDFAYVEVILPALAVGVALQIGSIAVFAIAWTRTTFFSKALFFSLSLTAVALLFWPMIERLFGGR